jgi:hypothetical protein
MPTYRGHYYDVWRRRADGVGPPLIDGVTPLDRGDADTKRAAETTAMSTIENAPADFQTD